MVGNYPVSKCALSLLFIKNEKMVLISDFIKKEKMTVLTSFIHHNKKSYGMKKLNFIVTLGLFVFFFFSCYEDSDTKKTMGVWDSGPITEYTVTPINGGAIITYKIPYDQDLLYIMAEYERNGKLFTDKSSIYKNELVLEGFHKQDLVKAKIYKVNKNNEKSASVSIEFSPLESLVSMAQKSLELSPGFGGIIANWDNPKKTELGIAVLVEDSVDTSKLILKDVYYSAMEKDVHAFRGFPAKKTTFAVFIEDKWGNISDTVRFTTTPFFETMIPKPYADFRANVPYDNTTYYDNNRVFSALWDNKVNQSGHGWLTKSGNSGLSITFDMKQVAKLSRIVIHGYHVNSMWGQVNVSQWEIWGIAQFDNTKIADKPYWLDEYSVRIGALEKAGVNPATVLPERTFKDDWEYLGIHTLPRLKDVDDEFKAKVYKEGMEYIMPLSAKPVRYIRMFVREITQISPPPANNYFSMGEITFYGDNTVPQN